ncbi:unnamed protein product [Sympodiomycopsis kandeliae]
MLPEGGALTSAFQVPQEAHGSKVPIPTDINAHTFLFSSHYKSLASPFQNNGFPDHTFDSRDVPPTRSFLVEDGTSASVTFARAKSDSERVAANLLKVTGPPLKYDAAKQQQAIHSAKTTVLLHLPNSFAFVILVLGSLRAQCTTTPISSLLSPTEIAYILAKARPRVIVTTKGPQGKGKILEALDILAKGEVVNEISGTPNEFITDYVQELQQHLSQRSSPEQSRIRTVDMAADYYGTGYTVNGQLVAADPEDWSHLLVATKDDVDRLPSTRMVEQEQKTRAAFLLWSSGTTGLPKGVLLSHRSVISGCITCWMKPHEAGPWRKGGERWIALAPWCHVFGLAAFLLAGLAQGATIVMPRAGRFDLKTFLTMLSVHRATWANVAPTVVVNLRNTPLLDPKSPEYLENLDLSDLKGFMAGGAPVAPDAIVAVYHRLGKYVQMGYGSSETVGTHQGRHLSLDLQNFAGCKELGSTGACLANCDVRIEPSQDLSASERLKLHEEYQIEAAAKRRRGEYAPTECCVPGEVLLKTPANMLGYYSGVGSDEGASAIDQSNKPFTADGWYRSGDEGVLDADGNLWIIGRTKETFKVKGFQVAPVELDSLFATHPSVGDAAAGHVHEAAEGSDFPIMYLSPKDADILKSRDKAMAAVAELSAWVRSRAAYYKWPRYFVFTDVIPRSPAGKILRKDLDKIEGERLRAPQIKSRL